LDGSEVVDRGRAIGATRASRIAIGRSMEYSRNRFQSLARFDGKRDDWSTSVADPPSRVSGSCAAVERALALAI